MLKRRIKYFIGKVFITDEKEIEGKIRKADVISFDIFDTLIKRNVKDPIDIYDTVLREFYRKNGIWLKDYKRKRVEAEQKARLKSQMEEVTLEEIYEELDPEFSIYREELKKMEIQMEIGLCCPNFEIKELYQKAMIWGKTVVITSDMYLPQDCIKAMLKQCGYEEYDKLYLSCVYRKQKSKGSLFQVILKEYVGKKVLHIGDDVKADYIMAKKRGIETVLIDRQKNKLRYWKKTGKQQSKESMLYGNVKAFLENHIPREYDDAAILGHEILAPFLLGFCRYLHEKAHKDKVDKIFFLSREGKIIMDAYKILYPKESIPLSYLYVSRQALVVPFLSDAKNFDDIINGIKCFMVDPRLKTIQKVCSLSEERYYRQLKEMKLDENRDIWHLSETEKQKLFSLIYEENREYFCQQKKFLSQYLEENGFVGNVGIVDVGWEGTMQIRLKKLVSDKETSIHGYYYGVRNYEQDETYQDVLRSGFLFEKSKNYKFDLMIRWSCVIFEFLFLNTDGSVQNYERKGERIIPHLNKTEYGLKERMFVQRMQETALNLLEEIQVEDAMRYESEDLVDVLQAVYSRFAGCPDMKTIHVFEKFLVLNGSVQKMLPDKSFLWYFIHPKCLRHDFSANYGKIWFLKKIFKISFPYFQFLYVMEEVGIKGKHKKEFYKN